MAEDTRYWFRAKKYGWGWGTPRVWQGWAVLVVFLLLTVAGIALFPPERHLMALMTYHLVCCAALIGVCYAKGGPPKWRWGDDER